MVKQKTFTCNSCGKREERKYPIFMPKLWMKIINKESSYFLCHKCKIESDKNAW